jgi:hypothetical protein
MSKKQPTQPIELDAYGVVRFQPNAILVYLFESKRLNLNDISIKRFPVEDMRQVWQQLGYSVSGYGDLSFADPGEVAVADAEAARLVAEAAPGQPR